MTEGREKLGMTRLEFGQICGCSETLITWLEDGVTITHPNIAARIVHTVGGTVEQYNGMIAAQHRTDKLPKVKSARHRTVPFSKNCEKCGERFIAYNKTIRFCCRSCANSANRAMRGAIKT